MPLLDYIKDLTDRVRKDLRVINGNLTLDNYLIDEFFHLVNDNWRDLRKPENATDYLELQDIVLNKILLEIIVDKTKGNLYNSTMTYNASCTEEDLHYFYKIPYGGYGEDEHLRTHTGYGNGVSDLDAGAMINLPATNDFGEAGFVTVGPKFEVKDYKDLESAKDYVKAGVTTSKFHDSNHIFIHLIDTTIYYIAENKVDTKWYTLAGTSQIKHYRQQVKLWMCEDGFLGVKFR